MQTDSYFGQGHSHIVCQDYAVNGEGYAIISDGCSNGGGPNIHTDFGSRIICKAAEDHLPKLKTPYLFAASVGSTAETQQRSFPNLPPECLTATLLVTWQDSLSKELKSFLIGDGVVAARQRQSKLWEIYNYEFISGGTRQQTAPYYLVYEMNSQKEHYFELFGGRAKRQLYVGDLKEENPQFTCETIIDLKQMDFPYFENNFDNSKYDLLIGMSDGAGSFYKMIQTRTTKHRESVPLLEVMRVLLDFSDFKGNFVERQCRWVFKRDVPDTFVRLGWINGDDFSMGAIYDGD